MLIQRIIFTALGAALYLCAGAFGDNVIEVAGVVGTEANFVMMNPTGVTRCVVTSNTGFEFSLVPTDENIPSGIERGLMDPSWNTCGMRILSPTLAHSGLWTIKAFLESNDEEPEATHEYRLSFAEEDTDGEPGSQALNAQLVDVFPSRTISIFPGNSMMLRLVNHYEHLISCIATLPNDEKFDVLNTTTVFSSDVRAFGQCGVIVRADEPHAGTWRIDATVKNDEMEELYYYGTFYVEVRNASVIDTEHTETHVQRGAPASIVLGPSEAVSCQLIDSRGQRLPVQSGNCHIDIPAVSNAHEGFWLATYSLRGKLNSVQTMTKVIAYDDHKLNATVTTMDNGEVNLLCSVRAYSFSFCQFVKPDGTVLNVFEGIGNDKYHYYGHGTQSSSMLTERTHDCGITILAPEPTDIGAWKCILDTSSGLTGSVLTVQVPGQSGVENFASEYDTTVYVVGGSSFTVKCHADTALKYCWMSSPNGTAYSVSSTQTSPTTLHYDGMGLSLGECGAVIPVAEATDEGEWKCGMGLFDGVEVVSTTHVVVTDTLLYSNPKNVTAWYDRAQLSCSLIPGHEDSIDYCRWISPNGSGIGHWANPDGSQYITHHTHSSCHLDIQISRDRSDIGTWTCVAGLVASLVEVSATIQVLENPSRISSRGGIASWCIGFGLGMISIIVAVVLVTAVRMKFRVKRKPDLPPSYEENQLGLPPPTTMHAHAQP